MTEGVFQTLWYGRSPLAWLLLPLSGLFFVATALRRFFYRRGIFRIHRVAKPVIVVGNLTVGGTGKTPFVIWLAGELRTLGHVPGVITRGYGGKSTTWPRDVEQSSDPHQVGDEAVLLAQKTGGIVVAGPDRVSAARRAIERGATLLISDDGLQHYRLARDIEIVVVDAERRFGNGWLLPAGPLRERPKRLANVDAVIFNVRSAQSAESFQRLFFDRTSHERAVMKTQVGMAHSLTTGEARPLKSFTSQTVHAIAGIGNPAAFFDSLRAAGLTVDARAFPDHAALSPESIRFADSAPILMTEKDAVKCRSFADRRCWAVALETEVERARDLMNVVTLKLASVQA